MTDYQLFFVMDLSLISIANNKRELSALTDLMSVQPRDKLDGVGRLGIRVGQWVGCLISFCLLEGGWGYRGLSVQLCGPSKHQTSPSVAPLHILFYATPAGQSLCHVVLKSQPAGQLSPSEPRCTFSSPSSIYRKHLWNLALSIFCRECSPCVTFPFNLSWQLKFQVKIRFNRIERGTRNQRLQSVLVPCRPACSSVNPGLLLLLVSLTVKSQYCSSGASTHCTHTHSHKFFFLATILLRNITIIRPTNKTREAVLNTVNLTDYLHVQFKNHRSVC